MPTKQQYTHMEKIVNSSAIYRLWYDKNTARLFVEFHSGNIAGYEGVTPHTYEAFTKAHSKGRFYNDWITRKGYTGVSGDVTFVARSLTPPKPTFRVSADIVITATNVQDAVRTVNAYHPAFEITGVAKA